MANEYTSTGALSVGRFVEFFDIFEAWGWSFTIFCTWTGFVLLFVGICWVISLPQKARAVEDVAICFIDSGGCPVENHPPATAERTPGLERRVPL